jgi:predicted metalloprotease with PDZ domain
MLTSRCSLFLLLSQMNKDWESKWIHLDAQHKHTVSKVNELSAMLADHQDCTQKLEEAKRDAQRALRSAELRRKIQEDARSVFAALKPQLGCEFQDHKHGAIISKVREGTPAARFGLQVKDVVISAGGELVGNRTGMVKACQSYQPGDTLQLNLLRGKTKVPQTLDVEVGAAGLTAEEVRDLKRRCDGRITEEDIQRSFALSNPIQQGQSAVTQAINQQPPMPPQQQQQQQQQAQYN